MRIKNPTIRKVKNRGLEPVAYHFKRSGHSRVAFGWINKVGRKWMSFFSPSTGAMRVLITERKHMRPL